MDSILAQDQGRGAGQGTSLPLGARLLLCAGPGHFVSLARPLAPPGKHGIGFLFMLLKPSRTGLGLLQGVACRQAHSEAAQARPGP